MTRRARRRANDAAAQQTTLVAAILGSGIATIDGTVVNVALPAIERDLGGGLQAQQWVANAYLLALGSLILIGGSLGDIYGERRVFALGAAAFGLFSVACALAPTTETLIVARGLQGAAGALLVPSSLAIIVAAFPRGRARRRDRHLDGLGRDRVAGRAARGRPDRRPALVALDLRAQPSAGRSSPCCSSGLRSRRRRARRHATSTTSAQSCARSGLGGVVFALIEQPRFGWSQPGHPRPARRRRRHVRRLPRLRATRRGADAEAGAVRAPQLRRREPRDARDVRGPRRPLLLPHDLPAAGRRLQRARERTRDAPGDAGHVRALSPLRRARRPRTALACSWAPARSSRRPASCSCCGPASTPPTSPICFPPCSSSRSGLSMTVAPLTAAVLADADETRRRDRVRDQQRDRPCRRAGRRLGRRRRRREHARRRHLRRERRVRPRLPPGRRDLRGAGRGRRRRRHRRHHAIRDEPSRQRHAREASSTASPSRPFGSVGPRQGVSERGGSGHQDDARSAVSQPEAPAPAR